MSFLRHANLRQKLTLVGLLCSGAALVTTMLALGAYEFYFYRRALYAQLSTMSSITARNSAAALAFASRDDATRVLAALEAEPTIDAAALYDARGHKFAMYRRPSAPLDAPALAPTDGLTEDGNRVQIVVPIVDGKRWGTLVVLADAGVVSDRIAAYALVLLGTTTVSGLVALALGGWLARRIAAPVQALSEAAAGVKTNADYSVRVPKSADDELGGLTDAFNAMLAQVQHNEAELFRSAESLRLAIESAKIGTWDWDMAKDEVIWNERNYQIFDVTPGVRITSAIFFALIHPEDRDAVREAVKAAADTGSDFAVEFRLARAEHGPRYLSARGRFLHSENGERSRALGVTVDISERRTAELRVAESETRFRAVAERAPAMIWSCDAALKRDYFNKTWLAFTGRTLEEELGDGWQKGLPGADLYRWQEMVGAAVAQLDPYTIEYRLRRADGVFRWVIETGSPRLGPDGAFAGYVGSCIDITIRKENEAELEDHVRRRTRELEAANQELESFSYSVSHDLRGPVRAIQGFAEIALEECQGENPAAAVERLQRVIKAAERMNKLIDAFISMARISRAELAIERVDLARIAEEVVSFLRSAHPERNVEVSIAPGLECWGDERLLRIVVENLVGNAWKFTAKKEHPKIEFTARLQDGERVFVVRDNGAGFNGAMAHKLFHAFERLHHVSQFEGLGVGLNTVNRVIEKHGGRVWAEAIEDHGATFYFTLPDRPVGVSARERAETAGA